jgi:hypothetical protein
MRAAGGYFHGTVVNAKAGELNLDRTLWAMRRAAEPKPPSGAHRISACPISSTGGWLLSVTPPKKERRARLRSVSPKFVEFQPAIRA